MGFCDAINARGIVWYTDRFCVKFLRHTFNFIHGDESLTGRYKVNSEADFMLKQFVEALSGRSGKTFRI